MENNLNQEENPFVIKKKPAISNTQPKKVFTANDFDEISPLKKKAQEVSPPDSASGSQTSGEPSPVSQKGSEEENNPFKLKPISLGNQINSTPTPSLVNGGGFMSDVGQNLGGEKYSPIQKEQSDKLKAQQAVWNGNTEQAQQASDNKPLETIKQGNKISTDSYWNLPGQVAGEAGKNVLTDSGNAVKTLSNAVSSNKKDFNTLSTAGKLDVLSDQSNPFSGFKNIFSAVKGAFSDKKTDGSQNLASIFFDRMSGVISSVQDNVGLGKVTHESFNNMVSAMTPEQRAKSISDIQQAQQFIDSKATSINDWQSQNPVEKNIFTSTLKAIGGFAPDIAIAALSEGKSAEISATKYASMFASKNMPKVIAKYAPKAAVFLEKGVESSLTKVFAVKGGLESGAKGEDLTTGLAKGIGTGLYMHTLGTIAGKVTPLISKGVSKATGLSSEYAVLFASPTANAGVFAGAKAISTPITEGRLATKEELYHELGMGIGMSALSLPKLFSTHREANQKASELLHTDPIVGLKDVLKTKNEDLLADFDPFIDVANLQKARDEIRSAILKEPSLEVKQELAKQGLELQKKIDTRVALNEILTNKQDLVDVFNNTKDLTTEQKTRVVERIEDIHNQFIKAEQQSKQQELSSKVEDVIAKNETLADDLVNATSVEEIAKIKEEATRVGEEGIGAVQEIVNGTPPPTAPVPTTTAPLPPKSFEVGEDISFTSTDGIEKSGFVKEVLPDNKAVVATVEDGIYKEETIDLPIKAEEIVPLTNEVNNSEPTIPDIVNPTENPNLQNGTEPEPVQATPPIENVETPQVSSEVSKKKIDINYIKTNNWFHGSENVFNTFENRNPNITGFWFSDSKDNASTYGSKVKSVKLDIENPLIIDAKGKKFTNEIEVEVLATYPNEKPYLAKIGLDVDEIVWMVKNGKRPNSFIEIPDHFKYDAVVFENIIDPSLSSKSTTPQTSIAVLDQKKIQSQDQELTNKEETPKSEAVDLDALKPKEKKFNPNSRTNKQLGKEPGSFNDAVNQYFLSGSKLSTEDFITHTGFGFYKESNGKKVKLNPTETDEYLNKGSLQSGEKVKMSDELRKAKFAGKVADRSKGGMDADEILMFLPEEFTNDQGMDLVTEIVNKAANYTKSQFLNELETSDPTKSNEDPYADYTEQEIKEMRDLEAKRDQELEKALSDAEISAIEDLPAISQHINNKYDEISLTDKEVESVNQLVENYKDENGLVDWDKFADDYVNAKTDINFDFLENDNALKTIFEYGSTRAKQQIEQRGPSKTSAQENNVPQTISNAERGTTKVGETVGGEKSVQGNEVVDESVQKSNTASDGEVQPGTKSNSEQGKDNAVQSTADTKASEGQAKIEKAKKSVDDKQTDVTKLQNEVAKLSEKLAKNLKENQSNLFGENKTQSLFDDKADQQKLFNDKVAELKKAQEDLFKSKQELADLKETEGQVELSMPESKVEIEGETVDLATTTPEEDGKIIVRSFINPLRIISEAQKLVDKTENLITERLVPKITDFVAEKLKAWRTSKSTAAQVSSSYASSIFGGIARSEKDVDVKLGLIGGKNMAVHNMSKVMKSLYAIVDGNTESLERIHVVLDPDFYQIGLGGQSNALNPNVPPNLTYNDLTAEEKLLFDEVRKNLDDIHFKNFALGFITKDTFDKHKGTYVPRMYETNELPQDVQDELDKYQDQVGDKLNLNPFKRRKGLDALSDESKNAILKDPVYLMAKRLMELDTNSAIMTYINHISRNNKSMVYEGDKPPFNYLKLEGKAYGSLNGKFVPSFIAEDLRGYMFVNKHLNTLYDSIKTYDRTWARQGVKKGLTVFNPFVQLGNFTSNVVFAQMAGVDFVRWFGNTPKAIKAFNAKGKDYEELLEAGLVGSETLAKDLQPNTTNANSLAQTAQAKRDASLFRKIKSPFSYINDKAMELYSGNDDYAKINAYQIFREQGYSKEEAMKKIYNGFQNYATVGKFWDMVSKLPIFGNPFMKFSADLMRITGNAVAKKPLSTSLYLAALYFLPSLILHAIGEEDDKETEVEKELRESRPFIPKMDLGFVNIPLVYKTKFGELNLSRYVTPYYFFDNGESGTMSSMLDRFNPYKSVTAEGYGKGNEITRPFGQDPVLGTLYNIVMDTDFRGKSIQDPEATRFRASGATDEQKWTNRSVNALRTWVPNGSLIHDTYLNAKYGEDFYGRTRTMAQSLINFAVKIQDFKEGDYKKTAEKQVYSLTNDIKSQNETIKNTYVNDARKRRKVQVSFDEGKIDPKDYQNRLEKFDSELKDRIDVSTKNQQELNKKLNEFKNKYKDILDRD